MQTWTYSKPTLLFWPDAAAGDAVPRLVEAGEPLDVEMDQVTRPPPLVAPDRCLCLERRELAEAEAGQLGRHRRAGEPEPRSDLGRGQPALPQPEDHPAPARTHPPGAAQRPRGAVDQAGSTFGPLAGAPFAHRAHADAKAHSRFSRGPAALDAGDEKGSTVRVGPRILVDVHSGPSKECWPRNPHSPAASSGEQPPWITQLDLARDRVRGYGASPNAQVVPRTASGGNGAARPN